MLILVWSKNTGRIPIPALVLRTRKIVGIQHSPFDKLRTPRPMEGVIAVYVIWIHVSRHTRQGRVVVLVKHSPSELGPLPNNSLIWRCLCG